MIYYCCGACDYCLVDDEPSEGLCPRCGSACRVSDDDEEPPDEYNREQEAE
jgi:hypothetical protein